MAQKRDSEEARRILKNGGFDLQPQSEDDRGDDHLSWTDGLPHDFSGWGPQTPDPDKPSPAVDLAFTGEADDHHHVWRFDMRRRRH